LAILIVLAPRIVSAQTQPTTPAPVDPRLGCDTGPALPIPDLGEPQNIDVFKKQLLYYSCTTYEKDVERVLDAAQKWVAARAPQIARPVIPAIVLDIDETSLSNWPRIYLDDFAYIANGTCDLKTGDPCGDLDWQQSGAALALRTDAEALQGGALHRRAFALHAGRRVFHYRAARERGGA
jgi:acid phosphatase